MHQNKSLAKKLSCLRTVRETRLSLKVPAPAKPVSCHFLGGSEYCATSVGRAPTNFGKANRKGGNPGLAVDAADVEGEHLHLPAEVAGARLGLGGAVRLRQGALEAPAQDVHGELVRDALLGPGPAMSHKPFTATPGVR